MNKKHIDKLGEDIASIYIRRKGYVVLDRDYYHKLGDINLVAEEKGNLYFIQVKTATCLRDVNHETIRGMYRIDRGLETLRLRKMEGIVRPYLEKYNLQGKPWSYSVIVVYLNEIQQKARVYLLKDMII
jgi:putative endonuclease